jgi:subtilase family serine protease
MFSRFATRFHPVVFCVLLMGFGAGLFVPVLPAQTRSEVIAALQPVKQADRIAANPEFGPLTRLSEPLPAWVRAGNQAAGQAIDLGATIHVSVVLRRDPEAEAAFEQLLANQQNPSSPLYHQWLTPQQVGRLFGPTQNDLAAVSSWLTSQGLKVDSIAPSGVMVEASGTMAMVGNAFHTSFGSFSVAGKSRLSTISEPSIPSALSPLIRSIHGLIETHYQPQSKFSLHDLPASGPRPQTDLGNGIYAILPNDFAMIYDIASVYSGGNKGATMGSKAQHVAIIGRSRVAAADITNYESLAGLPTVQPNVVLAGTDPGIATGKNQGDASEATLDVDRVIGTAPGAQVDLIIAASDTRTGEDGIDIATAYNINTLLDPVMTISFGSCEADNGGAETDYLNSEFEVAASEGISTFVSADDSGVAGCDMPFAAVTSAEMPQIASTNALCSSGYVTCVGGTEFNDTANPSLYWSRTNSSTGNESALSYIPEGAWNESTMLNSSNQTVYQVAEGGGGASVYIAKPSWQMGTGVPADGARDVPDVAFSAADHDGYLSCFAAGGGSCVATPTGTPIVIFSGTSATAPSMAGIVALLNTKLGSAQGNVNPLLYGLAAFGSTAFHDVTVASSGVAGCTSVTPSMCNNSTPGESSLSGGLAGYVVTAGYDQATGLGSVDVANLLRAATSGASNGTGSFMLAANPTTLTVTPVANTTTTSTATITGTSTSGFAGIVALSCAVTPATSQPPTCSVSPDSLTLAANGTATSTLTVTSAGQYSNCVASTTSPRSPWLRGSSGVVMAGFFLLLLPVRKRRVLRGLAMVCLLAVGLGSMSGCSGSSKAGGTACSQVIVAGTMAGTYTVTVTGTSGGFTGTGAVTFTVNEGGTPLGRFPQGHLECLVCTM